MGRAPCCEKMGLKKGPWTPEEDKILVAHIQSFGHSNWRALPKQAGLLRCGKSCRLRWINYLRPDIKRGNFSKEEEDDIIRLHEQLGNRYCGAQLHAPPPFFLPPSLPLPFLSRSRIAAFLVFAPELDGAGAMIVASLHTSQRARRVVFLLLLLWGIRYIILEGGRRERKSKWSAIAARLPGRTDNEIKNVWHTHLKKRLEPTEQELHEAQAQAGAGKKQRSAAARRGGARKTADAVPATAAAPVSPERSASSSVTESTSMTEQGCNTGTTSSPVFPKEESQSFTSSSEAEEFQMDESFWSETLSMPLDSFDIPMDPSDAFGPPTTTSSSVGAADDMDYWLRVFMETDDVHQELPQI
ncbi:hypothetical protein U9M48_033184 [Paspalum notatum var. saurae]|uniref:Uncharacterized protein n=1 Tax=Paspalum notatum var. saurae TaxID=547442 RepID=A0AAQ3X6E0_PASNO